MEAIRLLATLLPLSLTSGINLYATVFVIGITVRMGWVENPPVGFEAFGAWPVIVIAGVMYVIEFLADKIQFVDNIWDVVHTFIRPIGAAILGLAVFSGVNPMWMIIGALFAGGIALVSHGGKATARLATNVVSPMENVSNITISLAEDAVVGVMAFLALRYPYLGAGLALLALLLIVLVAPPMLRWVGFTLSALFHWFKHLGRKMIGAVPPSDELPPAHQTLLGGKLPLVVVSGKAQNVRGVSGYSGYAGVSGDAFAFTFEKWWKHQLWQVKLDQVKHVYVRSQMLVDVLEIHYQEREQLRVARFVFLRDRAPLVEQLAVALQKEM